MGPAYLVSVGYMDPGNWATDLQGGAKFGYQLIWVLLMSNLMALLLQGLSARLGIVRRRDLAQSQDRPLPQSPGLGELCPDSNGIPGKIWNEPKNRRINPVPAYDRSK